MNLSMIRYVLGLVMMFEGAFLSLPCVVALIYNEGKGVSFFIMMIVCLLWDFSFGGKPKNHVFYVKEGFVTVAASWIIMSFLEDCRLY